MFSNVASNGPAASKDDKEEDGGPSKRHAYCKMVLDLLLFYTTAFFVLLAVFSVFALIFLVPFFIDPAWSTLSADFDPKGTRCKTISGQYREGEEHWMLKKRSMLRLITDHCAPVS